MYRRNSNKFGRLDHRKSTSSAKSVHLEYIHPDMAERDAQAAAAQAFAMAKERSAAGETLWPPIRNNNSTGTSSHDGTPVRRSNDSVITRQQSVRFVRSGALQSTRNHATSENVTPASNANNMDGIEIRPTSSASAAGMVSAAKGAAGDYINALFTGEEYYTPEDDIASAPSSYRRIRKSRSMFTTSEASMVSRDYVQTPNSPTPNQVPPASRDSQNLDAGNNIPTIGLKAPKSMSFLRGRRDQSTLFAKRRGSVPIGLSNANGGGIDETSNNKEKPIKPRPSAFLRTKTANADKILRRSMRDSSNDTLHMDIKVPKDGSLRNRARKVSHNFKHKLKNLFGLAKVDTDEEIFPPQQVEASRSHNTDLDVPDYMKDDDFRFEPIRDQAALSRVTSGVPSLHAVPSHQQLRSRQGSLESLRSERRTSDEKSRVTSWTNSDTNTINTMNSHKGEWDRQRLSVIKEHGMHISSSSARPLGVTAHAMDLNTSACSLPPPKPPQPTTVKSQRIYSALMKRLNDTNKSLQRQRSVNDFIKTGTVPPRGSSRVYEGRERNSPATIRHVISDGVSDSSSVRTTERKPVTSSRRIKVELGKSPSHSNVELTIEERELTTSASAPLLNEPKDCTDGGSISSTVPPARTLSTRSSAFFASPTCHLFRTRSPYRRALQDSIKAESHNTRLRSPEYNPWMRSLTSLPIRCPSTCESEVDEKMRYAESVYSSAEEPATGFPSDLPGAVNNFPKPPSTHGDATIFVNPPVYRPTPPPAPKPRVASSTSSVEWKTWLSANVSKLEGMPGRVDTSVLEYSMPSTRTSGHVREEAQINDDDDELPPIEVYKPTRPNSALATIEQNTRVSPKVSRPILKSSSPAPHCDKENEVPERPEVPSRGALRTTSSLASMRSTREAKVSAEPTKKGAFDSIGRKSLVHKPSLNALGGNPTSTRKLVRKQQGFRKYVTPTSSPGPKATADKQSGRNGGSANSKRNLGGTEFKKAENVSPAVGIDTDADPYDVQGSGVLGPESGDGLTPQSMGSKKMVDLFLSSRRRRIASGEDGGVFM